MSIRGLLPCGTCTVYLRSLCEVLRKVVFLATGENPRSFCSQTLCSIAKHFFQASPYCFHLDTPILLESRVMHRQYVEATSKMIVIVAQGHLRLCEWIKSAFRKSKSLPPFGWCAAIDWKWQHLFPVAEVVGFWCGTSGSWSSVYEKNEWLPWFLTSLIEPKSFVWDVLGFFLVSYALLWDLKDALKQFNLDTEHSLVGRMWVVTLRSTWKGLVWQEKKILGPLHSTGIGLLTRSQWLLSDPVTN